MPSQENIQPDQPDLLESLEREAMVHTQAAAAEVREGDYVMAQGHAVIAHQRTGELLHLITLHVPAPTKEDPS